MELNLWHKSTHASHQCPTWKFQNALALFSKFHMVPWGKWTKALWKKWFPMTNGLKFTRKLDFPWTMGRNSIVKWPECAQITLGKHEFSMFPCCLGQTCSVENFGPICKFCKENNKCPNLIFLSRQLGQASGAKLHKDQSFPKNQVPRMESIGLILWGTCLGKRGQVSTPSFSPNKESGVKK